MSCFGYYTAIVAVPGSQSAAAVVIIIIAVLLAGICSSFVERTLNNDYELAYK